MCLSFRLGVYLVHNDTYWDDLSADPPDSKIVAKKGTEMTVPADLKIFSFIYEYRLWVLLPLLVLWTAGGFYLLLKLKKLFFLWLLIFPLVLQPLNLAATWCGWHYRMELYDRFAKTTHGWHDIDCMPPTIRAEYAKHNYRPRFRDMKAMAVGTIVITPILYALGGLTFVTIILIKDWLNRRKEVEKKN